jgi:opacity protein-like surface antigen
MKHFNSTSRQKPAFHKILVITIVFFFLALPAHALTEGPYFTLTGSIDTFEDMALTSIDPSLTVRANMGREAGLGFNHSIGYQFKNSFSTELEFSYKGGDFKPDTIENVEGLSGDMTNKSFLVNGIYSFNVRKYYTPYIGYGMGFAFHEAKIEGKGNREDSKIAYQLKTGIDIEFSRKLSLLVGYRYFTSNNPKFNGFFTAEVASHSIEAGVKFHF